MAFALISCSFDFFGLSSIIRQINTSFCPSYLLTLVFPLNWTHFQSHIERKTLSPLSLLYLLSFYPLPLSFTLPLSPFLSLPFLLHLSFSLSSPSLSYFSYTLSFYFSPSSPLFLWEREKDGEKSMKSDKDWKDEDQKLFLPKAPWKEIFWEKTLK